MLCYKPTPQKILGGSLAASLEQEAASWKPNPSPWPYIPRLGSQPCCPPHPTRGTQVVQGPWLMPRPSRQQPGRPPTAPALTSGATEKHPSASPTGISNRLKPNPLSCAGPYAGRPMAPTLQGPGAAPIALSSAVKCRGDLKGGSSGRCLSPAPMVRPWPGASLVCRHPWLSPHWAAWPW